MELLTYTFFQNAIIGSLLASILCGIVGTYIVTRRLVFISGGITHASFGGIGLGVYFGINPVISAMVFAVASSLGVQWLSHRGNVREDSTIAFFWTLGMSVGIICCFLSPEFMPDLNSYLFGSLLTIGVADLVLLGVLTLAVSILTIVFFRSIVSVAFDPVFSRAQQLPVSVIEYTLMAIIAMTIVATLRMVGIVLAISLLTIPQMTANIFTYSYKRMILLSIVFGWIDCLAGLAVSYTLNVPSGASIIFISIIVYGIMRGIKAITKRYRSNALIIMAPVVILALTSCSTQKNTSSSRWWHAFKARYNTYYNGAMAYIDGSLEKEDGNQDNYTELIPLYTVNNKNSKELGKSNFERAVTKAEKAIHQHSIKRRPVWDKQRRKTARDIEWLNRREYNPFLWKAWMLMGRSQFHMGQFDEAASTFSYMGRLYATQPAIYGKARAWLAKCYTQEGWLYDAEDVIRNMARDSMDWRAVKEWDYTYADYYIHTADYHRAIPYLRRVIRHEMRRKQRAREWFLLGQLYAAIDQRDSAYRAFGHVIRLNPPYQLEFNARIAQTEVMAHGQSRKMISKLRRMAASDNNKEYLDQVYYAIGNIYLADRDTTRAINAYERGASESTRNGIEKGVLLLRLGNIYWDKEKFSDARRCYNQAIGLLDQDRDDYKQLSARSKILDELVPHTEAIHLQDSLQTLANMSEKDRNAAIDRVIDALKKKEREERRNKQEAEAQQRQTGLSDDMGMGRTNQPNQQKNNSTTTFPTTTNTTTGNGQWYFYNPVAVSQGKATFQKLWGKRENTDNWQRINKTVVAGIDNGNADANTEQQADSIDNNQETPKDSIDKADTDPKNDPHKREYYLTQIPFTPQQIEQSNKIIMEELFGAGVIFKDKLDNLRLGEKYLTRIVEQYTDYTKMDEVYYHLYLLYMRSGKKDMAHHYLELLKKDFAQSSWTTLLTDPYFEENARAGVHLEDSLYANTYEAFKANRMVTVVNNLEVSEHRFPDGDNRDKFMFIGALTKLNAGQPDSCVADLKRIVERYPQSEISKLAGMIINGVNGGRQLQSAKFDMSDMWNKRSETLNNENPDSIPTFTNERDINFKFVIACHPDSVNTNQLLFELARYNFTNFMVRNFDIAVTDNQGIYHMEINGFRNYDEALQYARQLYNQNILQRYPGIRTLVISNTNLELIGHPYSYNDYDDFYNKHFVPLKISTFRLLAEPEEIVTQQGEEPSVEDIDNALGEGMVIDDNEQPANKQGGTYTLPEEQNNESKTNGTVVTTPTDKETPKSTGTVVTLPETEAPKSTGTVVTLPETENPKSTGTVVTLPETEAPKSTGTVITLPETETPKSTGTIVTLPETETAKNTPAKPAGQKANTTKPATKPTTQTAKPATPATKPATAKPKPVSKTGIYFGDKVTKAPADTTKTKKANAKTKKKFDLEDEYYDLEGF